VSLRFCDSFDHYSTAQIARKWTTTFGSPTIQSGTARTGSALQVTNAGVGASKALTAKSTWVVGFAVNPAVLTPGVLLCLWDSAAGAAQVSLRLETSGLLTVRRGAFGGALLGTTAAAVPTGAWTYVELKVFISGTVGTVDVQMNGVSVLSLTGQNTKNTANSTADTVCLNADIPNGGTGDGVNATVRFDDLYVCDGDGTVNNTFLGDVTVQCVFPTGAGATTGWAHTGAATNWQAVSETPADDDTSYVSASSVGAVDTYAHGAVGAGTVFGVQLCLEARKTDTGARVIQGVVRSGGADSPGTMLPLSTSYGILTDIRETDPSTGLAWTTSGINAAEIGEKLAS
jgi:hypothetical protein